MTDNFYGRPLAAVHDAHYSDHARAAAQTLLSDLRTAGHHTGTVVDLGCGGGVLAGIVTAAGYDVVGIDISPAMVEIARRRVPRATFRQGSIWDIPLPPAVGVTAIGEIVNYAADPRAGLEHLGGLIERAAAALVPGGTLLFDVATPGRAGPDGATVGVVDRPEHTMHVEARETTADDGTPVLVRRIELFARDGALDRRADEVHRLRLYDADTVRGLLDRAGFEVSTHASYGDRRLAPGWVAFAARIPGTSPAGGMPSA